MEGGERELPQRGGRGKRERGVMGNAESSSSELNPTSSRRDAYSSSYGRRIESKESEANKEGESSSVSLMAGAAVAAGAAIFALGALKLATSSSNASDDSDDRKVALEAMSSSRKKQQSHSAGAGRLNPYPYGPKGTQTLKFMTWNIWIQESVALDRRIKALGQNIQHHSPDVIMFQEVTRNMVEFFQNSGWFLDYKYRVQRTDKASSSLCVMMSKYPMEAEMMELDSLDESKFCVASISIRGRRLVTATCHLKSPTAPRNPSTKMRKRQAGELLGELDSWPNAVVGGDMNWVEDSIVAERPWFDAWTKLKRGEDGYTYDTVRNTMIANNNKVQKRLDRFICKLNDFKLEDIKLIGTEPVGGGPCIYRGKEVPLYSSDHFGLLLTISLRN